MDLGDLLIAEMFMGELEESMRVNTEKKIKSDEKSRKPTKASVKEELIEEMKKSGTLLPQYNWRDSKFTEALEKITAEWFARHPETTRGNGEFDKTYPEKGKALDLLDSMATKGRISPSEFVVLYKELYDF